MAASKPGRPSCPIVARTTQGIIIIIMTMDGKAVSRWDPVESKQE